MKLPSRRLLALTSCAGLIFCITHHGKCALVSVAHAAAAGRQSAASLVAQARASLSDIDGTKNVAGLQQKVRVIRDRWGVPHIYAQNEHDLFFAQGFVTAQDRLFQMELWKRVGQGRLAEVFGSAYLERDINARRLAYRGSMEAEYPSYSPDAKQIIEAFTQGINAEIAQRMAIGGPGLPLEFRLAAQPSRLWPRVIRRTSWA